MTESCDVILLAAGRGERLGKEEPKARVLLGGEPLFVHSLRSLSEHPEVERILLVASRDEEEFAEVQRLVDAASFPKVEPVIHGGERRQDSTWEGLRFLRKLGTPEQRIVLVHDAARPNVSHPLVDRCLQGLRRSLDEAGQEQLPGIRPLGDWGDGPAGVIPGLPVRETLKLAYDDRVVLTQPREGLHAAQTPQAFRFGPLYEAHLRARELGTHATDDARLLEWLGMPVRLVEGEVANIKVTYPDDLLLAEWFIHRTRGEG